MYMCVGGDGNVYMCKQALYYYYQLLHNNSISSHMFRLTLVAIIRESF
jgi:hypothetical protein